MLTSDLNRKSFILSASLVRKSGHCLPSRWNAYIRHSTYENSRRGSSWLPFSESLSGGRGINSCKKYKVNQSLSKKFAFSQHINNNTTFQKFTTTILAFWYEFNKFPVNVSPTDVGSVMKLRLQLGQHLTRIQKTRRR
jgi:hypothetical protein